MAIAPVDEVSRSPCVLADHCPLAAVGLVAPHAGFVAVQQIGQHRAVANLSRRGLDCVDQLAATVDPEMRLHPEVWPRSVMARAACARGRCKLMDRIKVRKATDINGAVRADGRSPAWVIRTIPHGPTSMPRARVEGKQSLRCTDIDRTVACRDWR